jgi:hypothetical protein
MAQFLNDTFTDTNDTLLTAHTGETGASWTLIAGSSSQKAITSNTLIGAGSYGLFTASGTPASADYSVVTQQIYRGNYGADFHLTGPAGRLAGSGDGYFCCWRTDAGQVQLHRLAAGSRTQIGSSTQTTPSSGTSVKFELRMVGSTIKVLKDDVEIISVTDTTYSAAGKAGVHLRTAIQDNYQGSQNEGWPILSITADDIGAGDTTAPSVPGSLTLGTRTASTLPFTWAASTDSGGGVVSGYKVQVLDNADTVLSTVDVGNVLTYTITGLDGNTLRKLRVAAYDNAVPANQSAYSSSVSGTTLSKTATVTVKDVNGSAQASETSLRWAACTGTIGSALAVVAQGTAESTDGSGNCVLDLNSTALAAGNSITVILADDSPSARLGVLEAVTVTES